jgi:peptidoglycan/LPS O-acetylase OafA/YrhL
VDLFFVLSGFLITRILLGTRGGDGFFRSFYARRSLRIFPLYYGALLFLMVILPSLPGFRDNHSLAMLRHHQVEYWTYAFNITFSLHPYVMRGNYVSFHFWSLAVEEQFYLIWPLLVLVLGRRSLGVFCLICIAAAPLVRYLLLHGLIAEANGPFAAYLLMPARMDTLALGGLIAVIAMKPDLLRRVARGAILVGVGGAVAVGAFYVHDGGLWAYREQMQIFGYSATAVTFAAILAMVVGGPPGFLQAVLGLRVLRFFGKYSYGLYIIHPQIMQWTILLARDHDAIRTFGGSYLPFLFGFTMFTGALSVAIAWLSWHLYEQQFLKLKRFVPYGRHAVAMRASA